MSSLFSKTLDTNGVFKLSKKDFDEIRDGISFHCGIYLSDNRRFLLEDRIGARLKSLNLTDPVEYTKLLRGVADKHKELNILCQSLTSNETCFYRNPKEWETLHNIILPEIIEKQRKENSKNIRLWSAGCSTGEEPYTIAILLHEYLGSEIDSWNVKIVASDFNEMNLVTAQKGIYNGDSLRYMPKTLINKYFITDKDDFRLIPRIKQLVNFEVSNLCHRESHDSMGKFQIIFCRNVLENFNEDMKKRALELFSKKLIPGGYLFTDQIRA